VIKKLHCFFIALGALLISQNLYAVTRPNLVYTTPNVYTVGTAVTLTPTNIGGNAATSCTIVSGSLPAGLTLSASGVISGTPTAVFTTISITINAVNAGGNRTTAAFTITVYPSVPTGSGGSVCTSGSVTLTASGSLPAGGTYNWYAAATGGASLASGANYSPTVTATTTYYVDYVQGGLTSQTRTAVTATVNAAPALTTMPTTGVYFSYPFSGNANDISGSADNGTVQGAAPLTTDRYGNANSAYSFNGSSQYISTAKATASPGPQNFSISVWFKTTTGGGMLVGFGASQTGQSTMYDRHIYMSNSGQLFYGIYPNAVQTINTTATYIDGNWHHVVATTSTTSGSNLYVDGALQATDPTMTTSQVYGVNGYWRVGYDDLGGWSSEPTNYYFTGSLDDIAVYTSALTASQVYSVYGAGSSPVCLGSTLSLQCNTVSGATYSWTGPGSFTSSSQNPTVTTSASPANAGTYTCTITSSSGCSDAINVTAVVNSAPSTTFTATSSISVGGTATITYTGTEPSTSTYAWTFTGGTPSTGSGQGPFSVTYSSPGIYTASLTVTNSSGCSATSTQTINAGYSTYAFSDNITLNTTSLGITSNLTNFPALLSIQDNNLIISGACTDKVYYPTGPAYDFAFYDSATSSELNYQVESYNQTTGTLLVWVKIPTLTHATNNTITFLYGSKTLPATHTTAFYESTWASDYKAVFHFNESSYTGSVIDGTAGGNTGTTGGMTSADLVTGKIGTAYSFNGSSKKITFGALTLTGTFTISAWVKLAATGIDQKVMTNQAAAGGSSGGYKLGVYLNNYPESESGIAVDRGSTPLPTAFGTGIWHYIQGVYTGSTLSTYVDGAQYEVLNTTNSPSSTNPFYIGVGEGGNQLYFNGIIDEPRVSNVAKTGDWIKAEYVDQNNPTTFTTVGSTITSLTNAAAFPGALTYTWTGATSTDPAAAANWNNTTAGTTSQLPAFDGSASLVVPAGLSNYPSLTASESVYGLTIASGASLNLNGYTLSVGCNIYNSSSGQILYGTSTSSGITWNGSAATQTYTGSSTTNTAALGNMTINNSAGGTVTISGGPVDIYNTLTITNGNLVVGASPAALTLKSTATLTASVAAIPSGSSITGTVSVERYVTGGSNYRGYRLISSPVYAATVSSNNIYSINYLQNSIYLTGNAGGGFDKTGNPTLYLYREDQTPSAATFTSGNFWGISAINNTPSYNYYLNGGSTSFNLPVGNGVMFFFRGNRASATVATETTPSYLTPVTVTMSTTGTLNQGQVIVHDWYTPASANIGYTGTGTGTNFTVRGFNLVGNPYASSIDWEKYNTTTTTTGIYANNVGTTIYEFDPLTHNYDVYQKGGVFTNHGSNIIASGQGFFVQATSNSSPQLIFNETAKTASQNTGVTLLMASRTNFAAAATNTEQHLRLQLVADTINTDDIYIGFNPTAQTQYVNDEDAPYIKGTGNVSMASFSTDSVELAINRLPLPKLTPTVIPLFVTASAYGTYNLNRTELNGIPPLYEIWLMDNYNKDSLDMVHNNTYAFDITADAGTYGKNRFQLVIRQNPALAIHLLNFTAAKATGGTQVTWTTENEQNYTDFTVQRSNDGGATYADLGSLVSSNLGAYNFLDQAPPIAADLYRLKIVDLNGTISYSKIVTLMYANPNSIVKNNISIYPNPAKNTLNVSITPPYASTNSLTQATSPTTTGPSSVVNSVYNIRMINTLGSVIKTATVTQQTWQTDVSGLVPGTYIIQVVNNYDNSIIGKGNFVKL